MCSTHSSGKMSKSTSTQSLRTRKRKDSSKKPDGINMWIGMPTYPSTSSLPINFDGFEVVSVIKLLSYEVVRNKCFITLINYNSISWL